MNEVVPTSRSFYTAAGCEKLRRPEMKRCAKCKKWKEESEFSKNRIRKDGLRVWCKDCDSEYNRKRYEENRGPLKYLRYEERHRVVDDVNEKRCNRCRKWKAESMFYKNQTHKDGLSEWCKECANKATNKARKKRRMAVWN